MPWFSIIISVYNRPNQIHRCISSCLAQTFPDYEIVVVDDASSDNTVEVIRQFTDGRVNLCTHDRNRGMSSALRTATDNAVGRWVIRVDSDHALLPNALEILYPLTTKVPTEIGVIGGLYQWDNGLITPRFIPNGVIDYEGRIRWVEKEGGTDYVSCIQREILNRVQWPTKRGSATALFQYDLAKHTRALFIDHVLGLEFTDATNSFHRAKRDDKIKVRLSNATDQASIYDEIITSHGQALKAWGPMQYGFFRLMAGFNYFLAGSRVKGLVRVVDYLRFRPFSLVGWALLVLGLFGPRFVVLAYRYKNREHL